MQVTNYVTRDYATLGPSELQPPFTRAYVRGSSEESPPSLTFWHWAGVSTYTSSYEFASTCVFGKQSPGPILCSLDRPIRINTYQRKALLIPKLRSQFAEFLNLEWTVPLGAFTPVCLCQFPVQVHTSYNA